MGSTHLHCVGEHTGQPKWHSFRELFTMHSHFKAVAKIDMNHFSGRPLDEDVGRMPVAKTEYMANHAIHCQGASVCSTSVKPSLRIDAS